MVGSGTTGSFGTFGSVIGTGPAPGCGTVIGGIARTVTLGVVGRLGGDTAERGIAVVEDDDGDASRDGDDAGAPPAGVAVARGPGPAHGCCGAGRPEDGEQLVPIMIATRERHNVRVANLQIHRVRFFAQSKALVQFEIFLDNGTRFPFDGTMIHTDGRWLVTRTTIADVLRPSGVTLPPPKV